MPQAAQYIKLELMRRIHICLEHRKALRQKVRVKDILNEVVELGLQEYARLHHLSLPPMLAVLEGDEEPEPVRKREPRR